jgi:hypothetical protein
MTMTTEVDGEEGAKEEVREMKPPNYWKQRPNDDGNKSDKTRSVRKSSAPLPP